MRLRDILMDCEYEIGGVDTEISGIAYDSRKVAGDTLFVAIRGENLDGHDFISDAVKRGAVAVVHEEAVTKGFVSNVSFPPVGSPQATRRGENLSEERLRTSRSDKQCLRAGVARHLSPLFIRVKDTRMALACISNNFYKRPSDDISVIGVTGTNGKTTTTHLIRSILEESKNSVGLIGTISYTFCDRCSPALHTTPESLEFQGLLRDMASAGCSHVITEVSSHALSQKRVDYTRFVAVVFTNLTRDHLDFHGTMEEYYSAKRRLFVDLLSEAGTAVINIDDEWGRRLLADLKEDGEGPFRTRADSSAPANPPRRTGRTVITYGIDREADVSALDIETSLSGVSFILSCGDRRERIDSPLLGVHNVYNVLSAISVALALDVPMEVIKEGIGKSDQVKGRFEAVDVGQDFLCIVDYAHTPDALERLILTARELIEKSAVGDQPSAISHHNSPQPPLSLRGGAEGGGVTTSHDSRFTIPASAGRLGRHDSRDTRNAPPRIITVFGCGGDRDRGKRPVMGGIATKLSDLVIITSDNPRSEDPGEIVQEIKAGACRENYVVEPDRRRAIEKAAEIAAAGDIVLIAGKGHENYQEIKGVRHPFSDREVAEKAIKNRKVNSVKGE